MGAEIGASMAELAIRGDELVVRLSPLESVAALHGDIRVPLAAVQTICAEPDPWAALRGMRAPGTDCPGVMAFGVRRLTGARRISPRCGDGGRQSESSWCRARQYGRLVVTVTDPDATMIAVRRALRPAAGACGPDRSGTRRPDEG